MSPEITAIRHRGGRKGEVELSFADDTSLSLSGPLAAGLRVGQILSQGELESLKKRDQVQRYYERSLRFLSYRSRSEFEVRLYLTRKGAEEEIREDVIKRLTDQQYLDDGRFSSEWVENRAEFRPRGKRLLESELRAKGIEPGLIAEALAAYDEEEAARKVASKASRKFAHLPREIYHKKFVGYLSRRGFPHALNRSLAESTWKELTRVNESEVET